MMRRSYLAIPVLLLMSGPALATPEQDSACLIGRLSAADLTTIVDESLAGHSEATVGRLLGPLAACSEGQNWVPERRGAATAYAMGVVIRDGLRGRLGARGVDTAALDRWFARQTVDFRTTAFTTMSEADLE